MSLEGIDQERAKLDREFEAATPNANAGEPEDVTEVLAGLTCEEELGLIQAIASLEAGNGRTLKEAHQTIAALLAGRVSADGRRCQ